MANYLRRNTGYTFMIEMLLAVLFFAVSAVILLQVFTAAKLQADKNLAQNGGLLAAQTALEEGIAALDGGSSLPGTEYFWYDEVWQQTDAESARFRLTVICSAEKNGSGADLYRLTAEAVDLADGKAVLEPLSALCAVSRREEAS